MESWRLKRNNIQIYIGKLPGKKLPILGVVDEENNCIDKVASFDSEAAANLFMEILCEFSELQKG